MILATSSHPHACVALARLPAGGRIYIKTGTLPNYPKTFGDFQKMGVYLFDPLTSEIRAGCNQTFKIKVPGAEKVAVISGDDWNYLIRNGDIFQGNAIIKKGDVDVAVKLLGKSGL